MDFRTSFVVRHVLPDDRLANGKIDYDRRVLTLEMRWGYVHPALVRDFNIISSAVNDSGLLAFEPDLTGPGIEAEMVRVEPWLTGDEPLLLLTTNITDRCITFEILAHEKLVDLALVREMNQYAIPDVCQVITPVAAAAIS